MMKWIKSLFCEHEYEFVRNIYGDEKMLVEDIVQFGNVKNVVKLNIVKICKRFPCYSILIIYMIIDKKK